MADAYTQVSSLNSSGNEAFDRLFYFALREKLYYDQLATVIAQPFHGRGTHTFNFTSNLAVATSTLTETTDPDAVAMADTEVQLTISEYGNSVNITAAAEGQDIYGIDGRAASVLGYNAGDSVDTLAQTALEGGTNVQFVGQASQAAITASDTLSAAEVREAVANLRGRSAPTIRGSAFYAGLMHPDQSYDLRGETGNAGWVVPANESDASRRWAGVVGSFEGVAWIETPRVTISADAGAATVDVYDGLVLGDECLAVGWADRVSGRSPVVRPGPVVDKLMRFRPMGWYWQGGYGRFREDSIQRVESASSIGAN